MAKSSRLTVFPQPGVYRGATADVSASRWWDMNWMRWRGDQLQPIGGWAAFAGIVPTSTYGIVRDLLTWHDNAGKRWLVAGTDNSLFAYAFETGTYYNLTPAGVGPLEPPGAALGYGLGTYGADAYGTARDPADIGVIDISPMLGDQWCLELYGEDLLILPTQDGRLFRWSPAAPDTPPAVVANAPTANAALTVTEQRSIVLVGAGGNVRNVAWSDLENTTVWAPDITNQAGSLQLETEGRPLAARKVPGGVLIWTDNDVHKLAYVGPPYAYGIQRIGMNCGPISRRSISQAGGQCVWMSQQTFWNYDGSLSPVPCSVEDWLFSILNRDMVGRIFGAPNATNSEHWFHWPDQGSQECNRYVAVNYTTGGKEWIIGVMDRTAADRQAAMTHPILSDPAGNLLLHEYGWSDNGAPRAQSIYAETGSVSLDSGGDVRLVVKQIVEDYTGPVGRVGYRFFIAEDPNAPEFDTGTFVVSNGSGRTDIDSGFSCRSLRMRVEAQNDGPWALGRTRLIVRPGGYL